jgi:hypothetical protein
MSIGLKLNAKFSHDAPPRSGTPEYDAWMAARAQEAARPKTNQSK